MQGDPKGGPKPPDGLLAPRTRFVLIMRIASQWNAEAREVGMCPIADAPLWRRTQPRPIPRVTSKSRKRREKKRSTDGQTPSELF